MGDTHSTAKDPWIEQDSNRAGDRLRELEELAQEFQKTEAALKQSEATYRSLFENSPVSLWEEDFSKVKVIVDRLRDQGVTDFEKYFREHPEAVEACVQNIVIKDVNQATVELYEASSKEELLGSLHRLMAPESTDYIISELATLARGRTVFEGEIENITLKGRPKLISVILRLAPGHEETWDRVYVSIMDITRKRRVEMEQLHLEKLRGVLETAGAACHDLNQPLQTIVGQLELLLLNLDKGPEQIRGRVETVLREIDRMTEITRKLSRITSVESTDYVSGEKILDLDRSTGG